MGMGMGMVALQVRPSVATAGSSITSIVMGQRNGGGGSSIVVDGLDLSQLARTRQQCRMTKFPEIAISSFLGGARLPIRTKPVLRGEIKIATN